MNTEKILLQQGLQKIEVIQSLWSGYGEIARYRCTKQNTTLIVKQVELPERNQHPRGWNTATSQQRKIDSYLNEARFYQHFADKCPADSKVPTCIQVINRDPIPLLIMEDLDASGFPERRSVADLEDVKACIRWLAGFHARFLSIDTRCLWPVGTYWHLATRQDEYKAMDTGPLKRDAGAIDKALNQTSYQTLLHGDAKLANFCFSSLSPSEVAAVDFQYTGRGAGVKDLAYLLGSCLSESELFDRETELLNVYFECLKEQITRFAEGINSEELELQWRRLYPVAWADFYRFLRGWSPQHRKINGYMKQQYTVARKYLT